MLLVKAYCCKYLFSNITFSGVTNYITQLHQNKYAWKLIRTRNILFMSWVFRPFFAFKNNMNFHTDSIGIIFNVLLKRIYFFVYIRHSISCIFYCIFFRDQKRGTKVLIQQLCNRSCFRSTVLNSIQTCLTSREKMGNVYLAWSLKLLFITKTWTVFNLQSYIENACKQETFK